MSDRPEFVVLAVPHQWSGPDAERLLGLNGFGAHPEAPVAEPETTSEAALGFAERLRRAQEQQAAMDGELGTQVSARERDLQAGVTHMFEHVLRVQQHAERIAAGEGTPLSEVPFDAPTQTFIGEFLGAMNDGASRRTWTFYEMIDVTPARPALPAAPDTSGMSRRNRDKAIAAYQAELAKPVEEPEAAFERRNTKEIKGWSIGYVTQVPLHDTPAGREVWTSMMTAPDEAVLGEDGKVYTVPNRIAFDGTFVNNLEGTQPGPLPLDMAGRPRLPQLGECTRVRETTVDYNGNKVRVLYAELTDEVDLGDHLIRLALRSGARLQETVETVADEPGVRVGEEALAEAL